MVVKVPDPKFIRFIAEIEKRSETFGGGVFSLALIKNHEDKWKVGYSLVTFLEKTNSLAEDQKLDYGNFILIKKFITVLDAINILNSVFVQENLKVDDLPEIPMKVIFCEAESIPSAGHNASDRWPSLFVSRSIENPTVSFPSNSLSKLGLPLYPSGSEAVVSFMGLKRLNEWYNPGHYFEARVPDFRARIKSLRLAGNRVTLEVETRESPEDELRAKFYCRNEDSSYMSDDLTIEKGIATFVTEKEPTIVEAHILSIVDGESIDHRSFNYKYPSREGGIVIENSITQLLDVINKGENENVEFKELLDGKHSGKEFLETVVAFANTRGGTIFLGISDNCKVIGFGENVKAKIEDLIDGNCEPSIHVQVNQTTTPDRIPITIIEVPEGKNKPYILANAGIYVRRGSSDRQIKRTELDDIITNRNQNSTMGL